MDKRPALPVAQQLLEEMMTGADARQLAQARELFLSLDPEDLEPFVDHGIFKDERAKYDGYAHAGGWSCSGRGLAAALRLSGADPALQAAAAAALRGSEPGVIVPLKKALPLLPEGRTRDLLAARIAKVRRKRGIKLKNRGGAHA